MHSVNWQGIATLIGAVGGFLTVLVTLAIQIINFRDARRIRLEQAAHKDLLCAIHTDVQAIKKADA
jgi:hypothetical protein